MIGCDGKARPATKERSVGGKDTHVSVRDSVPETLELDQGGNRSIMVEGNSNPDGGADLLYIDNTGERLGKEQIVQKCKYRVIFFLELSIRPLLIMAVGVVPRGWQPWA